MGTLRCEKTLSLYELFEEGTFSDVTIKCGPRVWNLHRMVLSRSSAYFFSSLTIGLEEANTCVITVSEDDYEIEALDAALRYIYYEDLNSDHRFDENIDSYLAMIVRTYKVADYFAIDTLEEALLELLASRLKLIAIRWQCQQWSAQAPQPFRGIDLFAEIAEAVEMVYAEDILSRLRPCFVNAVRATHWFALRDDGLDGIMEATPAFAYDVLRAFHDAIQGRPTWLHLEQRIGSCSYPYCGLGASFLSDTEYFASIGLSSRGNKLVAYCNNHHEGVNILDEEPAESTL